VQGLNPPRGRWPPDQLAGAEGQGHPQLLWAAAARPGLVFLPLHAAVGILLIAQGLNAKGRVLARKGRRRRNTSGGRRPGSPRIGWPAGVRQGRPMAARTSGRWRTGLPPAWRSTRPLVTGGGGRRRPGSPRTGRPAGHCQGHTFFPRPPSGPTTFWTVARGFGNPVGHPGVSRGVCSLSGKVTPERRQARIVVAAATVRWRCSVDQPRGLY
jgi:hypothetical protein